MIKIGIEMHIQLSTQSKIFCPCSTKVSEIPNINICEICTGMPGSKPVLNKRVIEEALKVALALNCKINKEFFFSRKSYFYPDLPKNFQITQYEIPIAISGQLDNIKIRRIHLEEDPGRLIHKDNYCLIDYNRSGIPLIEIVTEPDFKSAEEVRQFLNKLTTILEYLNVYTRENEASLRTDANISVEGVRVEVKNITGIKDVEKALNYEIIRQQEEIKQGKKILMETRSWDPITHTTRTTRIKEEAEEYGYIAEPDLPRIELSDKQINEIKKSLPELAHDKELRFIKQYKIAKDDSKIISSDLRIADFFEQTSKKINPVLAAKWTRRELLRVLNYNKIDISETKLKSENFIELLSLLELKKITDENAKRILEKLIIKPFSIKDYIKKQNLKVISSEKELEDICKKIIKENPQPVQDYKNGQEKSLNFLIGQVMKLTKGQASPEIINKIIKKLI